MRVGVIGTNWGRMHVGAFRAAGAEVVGLCGRNAEKTRAIAQEERIPLATTDVGHLCAAVDAVVVASPDEAHVHHVRAALAAKKPVLCEKPLATSAEDARALADEAARAGVVCAVNFPYRFLQPVRSLRAFVREHRPVHSLEVVFRNAFLAGGTDGSGDFGGASHVVDAALFLLGEGARVRRVDASLAGRPVRATHLILTASTSRGDARAMISHRPGDEPGTWGSWSLAGEGWEAGFSAGYRPELGGWRVEPARAWMRGAWRDLSQGERPEPGTMEPWAAAHVDVERAFLGVAQRGGAEWPESLPRIEDGVRVQEVLAAAIAADETGHV